MNIQFYQELRIEADRIARSEGYERDYLDIMWEVAEPMINAGAYTLVDYEGCEETANTSLLRACGAI